MILGFPNVLSFKGIVTKLTPYSVPPVGLQVRLSERPRAIPDGIATRQYVPRRYGGGREERGFGVSIRLEDSRILGWRSECRIVLSKSPHQAPREGEGMRGRPLVWVVTPVHNGERYLAECIESVLAQTYDNWEYLVVDNCSTDRTSEIVRAYCQRDERVRLERNSEFLPMIANWNRALRMIPRAAKYCKVVHADDALFPHCLERMVEVAERHSSVAIVSSHALWGDEIRHREVPYPIGGRRRKRRSAAQRCWATAMSSDRRHRCCSARPTSGSGPRSTPKTTSTPTPKPASICSAPPIWDSCTKSSLAQGSTKRR